MDRSRPNLLYRWLEPILCITLMGLALSGCRSGDLGLSRPLANDSTRFTACRLRAEAGPNSFTELTLANMPGAVSQSMEALDEAERLDRQESERCVDLYYQATLQAAQILQVSAPCDSAYPAAWNTYHCGLRGLIDAGQRHGRLDPRKQLKVYYHGKRLIPISYCGFAWRPSDFNQLVAADHYHSRDISHDYATPGLGHTLVGIRDAPCASELFFRPRQTFAVTAVLRPVGNAADLDPDLAATGCGGDGVLELYNSNAMRTIAWRGTSLKLARDTTAPLAAVIAETNRQYLRGFTAPSDTSVQPKLAMLEPYQRGKIPVVFIHGLYSDPITWADAINTLRAHADIYQQFQFWVFRYPTGGEIIKSITELRTKLQLAREVCAPQHDDPALDQMVLIGHSLGGLVAKMQIVGSGDILWNHIANRPFDAVRAPPAVRMQLSQYFFFDPLPFVNRVVFIGTPHQGSGMTRRLAGRVGEMLVRYGSESDEEYRGLMGANEDVFKPEIIRKRPTSIDMLEPTSPFLVALRRMPINPSVHMHSIIGTGGHELLSEPGDGVVTISSARQPGVESELYVPAKHEKLHRDTKSIAELTRILRMHVIGELPCSDSITEPLGQPATD